MRMGFIALPIIGFFPFSRIAKRRFAKALFRKRQNSGSSTQSLYPLQARSKPPILLRDARHAPACLAGPNARFFRLEAAHRDLSLFRHPWSGVETGSRYMRFLSRSAV